MRKIYHLANCDTCQKILKDVGALQEKEIVLQDIKTEPISPAALDTMKKMAGSYEALFSRRAIKYRLLELGKKQLKEEDYRQLILEEYTFLKRPVAVIGKKIFIGNTKEAVLALKAEIDK